MNVYQYVDDKLNEILKTKVQQQLDEMSNSLRESISNTGNTLKEDLQFQIVEKTNGLGEEVAADVNSIETRIKDLHVEINQFKSLTKKAMLSLEKKIENEGKKSRKSSKSRDPPVSQVYIAKAEHEAQLKAVHKNLEK